MGLTSDHTAGNLPYGASKGTLDRIVLASARELARCHLGITANVVNPGATDTGWMTPQLQSQMAPVEEGEEGGALVMEDLVSDR